METRTINLPLNKAKEWYKKGGELKEIALQAFNESELNPLPKSWEEYTNKIVLPKISIDKMLISSLPKKYIVLYKLEQLRNCYRQGWIPEDSDCNWSIVRYSDTHDWIKTSNDSSFLSFKESDTACQFLNNFNDLITEAEDLI